jgi:hypothetical protein
MRDDFHDDDPKTIWQHQPTETSKMSLVLIRQKGRQLQAKTRRQRLGPLTGPFIVAFFYAFLIRQFPQLQQVLQPLSVVALAWSLAGLYFLNRGKRSGAMPGDAGFSAGLEFCRREIERQRDYFRRVLLWSFGPMLLAVGTVILVLAIVARGKIFANSMLFMTLLILWIATYFIIRIREQRELQREIDELNDIDRENSRN